MCPHRWTESPCVAPSMKEKDSYYMNSNFIEIFKNKIIFFISHALISEQNKQELHNTQLQPCYQIMERIELEVLVYCLKHRAQEREKSQMSGARCDTASLNFKLVLIFWKLSSLWKSCMVLLMLQVFPLESFQAGSK